MNQEPMPVTEDLLGSVNLQNKQSTHQRQTKKGWNRCPPKKAMMERMTPETWNRLAWFPYEPLTLLGFPTNC